MAMRSACPLAQGGTQHRKTDAMNQPIIFFSFPIDRPPRPKKPRQNPKKTQTSLAAPEFIYVRVKRRVATYFLRVEPTERVRNLKLRLEELVQKGPEEMRLVKLGGGGGGGGGGGATGTPATQLQLQRICLRQRQR